MNYRHKLTGMIVKIVPNRLYDGWYTATINGRDYLTSQRTLYTIYEEVNDDAEKKR